MIFCVTRLGIGTKKTLQQLCVIRLSDSGGIRTHDPQLRRLLLYPAELRNHPLSKCNTLRETAFVTFCGAKVNKIYRTTKFFIDLNPNIARKWGSKRKKGEPRFSFFYHYATVFRTVISSVSTIVLAQP